MTTKTEADAVVLESDLDAHSAAGSGVHGVSGDVVGTEGAQVLQEKTLRHLAYSAPGGSLDADTYTLDGTETPVLLGDATSGAVILQLPDASDVPGRAFIAKKMDSSGNAVTFDADWNGGTVDGGATVSTTTQWGVLRVYSTGGEWITI